MHYYRFNIPDWVLHTAHLTPLEEGVYLRLVNFYYDTEQPIPADTQWVIRRLRLGSDTEAVANILREFFALIDGFWIHKRCDIELENYHAMVNKNRVNAKRGGRPKKSETQTKPKKTQSVNLANPNISLTNNQEPITNNQIEDQKIDGAVAPPRKQFVRPSVLEVTEYVNTRVIRINPQNFVDHYTANGWKVGRNSMKDWKAAVRTWEKNEHANPRQATDQHQNTRRLSGAERTRLARQEAYERERAALESSNVGCVGAD